MEPPPSTKIPPPNANNSVDTLQVCISLANTTIDTYKIYNPVRNKKYITPILQQLGIKADYEIIVGDLTPTTQPGAKTT
jgi:hypothetical protein